MGFRFRKSFKIAPGIRLNLSNKSAGLSIGGKGFRHSINTSGRSTTTVGLPGTGLSYQTTSGGKKSEGGHSALYWVFVGWWWFLIKWAFLISLGLIIAPFWVITKIFKKISK